MPPYFLYVDLYKTKSSGPFGTMSGSGNPSFMEELAERVTEYLGDHELQEQNWEDQECREGRTKTQHIAFQVTVILCAALIKLSTDFRQQKKSPEERKKSGKSFIPRLVKKNFQIRKEIFNQKNLKAITQVSFTT